MYIGIRICVRLCSKREDKARSKGAQTESKTSSADDDQHLWRDMYAFCKVVRRITGTRKARPETPRGPYGGPYSIFVARGTRSAFRCPQKQPCVVCRRPLKALKLCVTFLLILDPNRQGSVGGSPKRVPPEPAPPEPGPADFTKPATERPQPGCTRSKP